MTLSRERESRSAYAPNGGMKTMTNKSSYRVNSYGGSGMSFYRTGGALHSYAPIPSDSCLDSPRNDGSTIRMRVARALSEASYPHLPLTAWEQCEACAILADSLR